MGGADRAIEALRADCTAQVRLRGHSISATTAASTA